MPDILVLYYSRYGATRHMAECISQGIESVAGMQARIRTVPPVSPNIDEKHEAIPEDGPPYVTHEDLESCVGLAMGSPTRFGNMAAPLKYFWDTTAGQWFNGTLSGKPACVFTSTASMHGGQESTLLSMMLPLMHHGMIIMGIPFTEAELTQTQTGGTPYGASHYAGSDSKLPLSDDEIKLCKVMGERLAKLAQKLQPK